MTHAQARDRARERNVAQHSPELQQVLRLLRWLEPGVAIEVCRLATRETHTRWINKQLRNERPVDLCRVHARRP